MPIPQGNRSYQRPDRSSGRVPLNGMAHRIGTGKRRRVSHEVHLGSGKWFGRASPPLIFNLGDVMMVDGVKPKYCDLVGACVYTGKSVDKIEHAARNGHLKVRIAKDKTRSFAYEDLDDYMSAEVKCGKDTLPFKQEH